MSSPLPAEFENVRVQCKANVYFDGKVVSHTIFTPDGGKKTLGVIFPGTFEFNTSGPERMDLTSGSCRVRVANGEWRTVEAGSSFKVGGNSSFTIVIDHENVEYICSFE